jgi:hypothetical protein
MATKKRSDLEAELMTDANISRVIRLLEPQEEGVKPITKKDACQILGMAYNTTRLGTIIEEFKKTQARNAQRRAELRGKPASREDIVYIISEYLNGETVDAISKMTYRSPTFIKRILEENSVPIRVPGSSYFSPEMVPEGAQRDRFRVGEVVYSTKYDSTALIESEKLTEKYGYIYRIFLMSDKWLQSAWQEHYELASLQHLRELGVRI